MPKIRNNIKLLSIHIPKTAGSSFQKTLETIYGKDVFCRLDFTVQNDSGENNIIAKNQTRQEDLDSIISTGSLNNKIEVLHGHIHFQDFNSVFESHPDLKVITWLRHPVERVISNYNYLRARFEAESTLSPVARKLFNRLVMSLLDFARLPRDIHMYRDYTTGKPLEDFDFIGITEDYDNDLERLARILDWPSVPSFHINKTQKKPFQPTESELQKLVEICSEGLEVYNRAKELKIKEQK